MSQILIRSALSLAVVAALAGCVSAPVAPDEFAQVAAAANEFFASGKPLAMKVERLQAVLTDKDLTNDPVVLSVCQGAACAQSEPSIVLPPAEVILKAAAEMGVEAVNAEYVLSKLPQAMAGSNKVFFIDARPARSYDEGHIPTEFNMFDAKFKLIYPEFEKLGVPKDAEIFLGIGRPCPMSINDAKLLKEKGAIPTSRSS